jgi:hypothetical protein
MTFAAGLSLLGTAALAQDGATLAAYFPLDVGRVWTYHLQITSDKQTRTIEYSTRVARVEDVDGLACAVFEDFSNDRVLQVSWYALDRGFDAIVQPRQQRGRGAATSLCRRTGDQVGAPGRILLDGKALAALPATTSWEWASPDGTSKGTVTLTGREKLRLRNFGELDCLVLRDEGTSSSGDRTATVERTLWLAEGLGCVQERAKVSAGARVTETEATLVRHDAP